MKIAIASGKGGTGKTTLSTNLASYLAEGEQVVLADLDVEEPNSGLFFKGNPAHKEDKFKMVPQWIEDKCTLCGICQKVCNFHAVIQLGKMIMVFPELCHGCYACSELCPESALPMTAKKMGELSYVRIQQLNFVESRLDIGEEQAVPLIRQTKAYVDKTFFPGSFKIYDAPAGTSCPVIEATKDADFVILVTEPTPFGLHDLKLAIETMRELKRPFGVVINRNGIGNDNVKEYCKKEDISVLASIPNNQQIARLYSQGKLIYREIAEFRKALDMIITHLRKLKSNQAS